MSQSYTNISIRRISGADQNREPEKAHNVIILVLCVLVVVVSLLLQHDGNELHLFGVKWPISCALYEIFGIKCALCGLTRSFCAMGAGEFSNAVYFHPLGPAIFIFICLQIPYRIHALWTTRQGKKLRRIGIYMAIALLGALLINWFVYLGGLIL